MMDEGRMEDGMRDGGWNEGWRMECRVLARVKTKAGGDNAHACNSTNFEPATR